MKKLPDGWWSLPILDVLAPLDDGKQVHQGWSPRCENVASTDPKMWGVLKTTAIQDGSFHPEHNKLLPDALSPKPKLEVKSGDLLLTCAGPRVRCGVACLVRDARRQLIISGKMYRFRANQEIVEPRFLEAYLRSPDTKAEIDAMKTGISESGMNITRDKFARLLVPLPPLAEQKRIADKLDAVLARVDACRDRLDRVGPLIKRFRQAVLAAATSGRLTEDWRARAGATDWVHTVLSELCVRDRVITYGVIKLGNDVSDGVPCLRTSNVRWLSVDTDGMKRIAPDLSAEYRRTILRGGEILVNVRGTLGGVAAATQEMIGWNVSREVAVVPVDERKVVSAFMALWIAGGGSQSWLRRTEKGVAYVGINIEDLRNLPVQLPSLLEQSEIVRRVEKLFAFADALEARLQAAHAATERLGPALLAKAFRGELVSRDPNDEPAAELLRRLHDGQKQVVKGAKASRSRPTAMVSLGRDSEIVAA